MASNSTVIVKNIASATGDSEVKDFFSFCGKISNLKVTAEGETKSAEVTFEKETAMKTALLLNNTQLGPNQLSVVSASGAGEDDGTHYTKSAGHDSDEITQEEKPRARIFAEYLAHGYVVGDAAIERALELDKKHGVTNRFVSTLQGLDHKYHASDRARATDQSYGISNRANSLFLGLNSYFEKASNTPTGKKIVNFYTEGSRQVNEVHVEARRLAELKKGEHGGSAYKAAGLEKVFGKEKAKEEKKEGTAADPAQPPATSTPSQAAPTEGIPAVKKPE